MFRRLTAIVPAVAMLTATLALDVASAQERPRRCVWESSIQKIICYGEDGSVIVSDASPSGTWPPEGWTRHEIMAQGPDGRPCLTTTYRPPTGLPPAIVAPEDINPYDGGTRDPTEYPQCPAQQGNVADPAVVAASYWEAVPVPRPRPHIAPGWAITGKTAFLETNGQLTFGYTTDTPIGGLAIQATARYYVEWGDGERTGPYSFEGRPWPDGRITHDYIWKGEKDIVLTARWDATWQLGGSSGVLRDRDITARIDDFPVREIQAVIITGP